MRKNLLLVISIITIISAIYIQLFHSQTSQNNQSQSVTKPKKSSPQISSDSKEILDTSMNNTTILKIDDDSIFSWFQTESQLCDPINLTSQERQSFCTDKQFFRQSTKFKSISVAKSGKKIGFTIDSSVMTPDTVAGIIDPDTKTVNWLTNYYLDNLFIGFSPNDVNFIYQTNCFEGLCSLIVANSDDSVTLATINNPESIDAKTQEATFLYWVSDQQVAYKLGEDTHIISF